MRPRINRVMKSHKIAASTNPELNIVICNINGRSNNLEKPIMVGERLGITKNAVLQTKVVSVGRFSIDSGTFKCATNKARISDRVIDKMTRKIM